MYRQAIIIINILLIAASAFAGNSNGPTDYTFDECRGSANPYPAPESRMALPDTLSVIMINHLGRHGARYETSPKRANKIRATLMKAKKQNTLSAKGDSMLDIVNRTIELSKDNWGALDSLGMKEQQGIAARIYRAWPALVKNSHIEAISSYIPRCIMSMYEFTHKLSSIDDNVEILTSSGKVNSPLMRPFAIDSAYLDIRKDAPWAEALDSFYKKNIPLEPVWRLVGHDTMNRDDARQFAISLFGFLCGLNASGIDGDFLAEFYTIEEANKNVGMPQYNAISRTNHIGILVDTVGHNACVACRFHKHDRLLFVRTFQSIIKSEVRTRRNCNAFFIINPASGMLLCKQRP